MTEIQNPKQEKDERRTSNAQHRTSNVGVASLRFFSKIETPKAYHNSTLEVRCSMLDVRFLIRFWSLPACACPHADRNIEIWNLVLGICDYIHKIPRQSHLSLTWPRGPGFQWKNKKSA